MKITVSKVLNNSLYLTGIIICRVFYFINTVAGWELKAVVEYCGGFPMLYSTT